MRVLTLASLCFMCVSFTACGDDATPPDMAMPDLAIPDLIPPPDLTMFDFKGVTCGTQSCDNTVQECCLMVVGMAASGQCVAKNTCNKDAGAQLTCDGPEDCTTAAPSCCISIGGTGDVDAGTISGGSGQSSCTNTCSASAAPLGGGFAATSKMCHVKKDCTGYKGVVDFMGMQTLDFTFCCEVPQAPGLRFCAPSLVTQIGGTCFP
jgi:hypothetical protein